ncbi:TIGR03546 family protein [Candidatus Kryptobacter tengchongensis]|nr:TIGR03546 family protein [Candidatus Kryptobacter tengchongensis]CUS92754.1 TIGR03546 family protein [Candidatus Kryptobacter tengchongensis]CUU04487.1 TIGR03546 family protein [Candidatus Kryptobacter tengchongensis]
MPILQLIAKIVKILRSQGTPGQVAAGFAFGMCLGLIPWNTLHSILIWIIVIVVNVNFGAVFLGIAVFGAVAYIFDPFFHSFGYWILVDVESLRSLWTSLYQSPVIPFTRFYNTVVMGSTVISFLLFFPVYFGSKWLVKNYREKVDPHIQKLGLIKAIKASKIYQLYQKIKFWSEVV